MSPSFDLAIDSETTDATSAWTFFESILRDGGTISQGSTERRGILGSNEESPTVFQHSSFSPWLQLPSSPPEQPALCAASSDLLLFSKGHTSATSTMSDDSLHYPTTDGQYTLETSPGVSGSLPLFSFHGTDPESIIPSLQLMRSQLLMCLDDKYRDSHLGGSRPSRLQLAREITSDWLLSEMDDMLCWSYDVSASLIRQRRAGAGHRLDGYQNLLLEKYRDDSSIVKPDAEDVWMDRTPPKLRGRLTSSLRAQRCRTSEIFQVQLREVSTVTESNDHRASYFVRISFIPEIQRCTTGISVTFSGFPGGNQHPRLCPSIRTFNVVPEDSEIITCVEQNDLKGVQRLLDEHKASTLDVDPLGCSLLSVSETALYKEVR